MSNIDRGVGPVIGTTTNDSATAGQVGEFLENGTVRSSATSLTDGTYVNLGTITLSAGDWDVNAVFGIDTNASTSMTSWIGSISKTSITPSGTDTIAYVTSGESRIQENFTAITGKTIGGDKVLPTTRVTVTSGTQVMYLVARASFTVSTASAYGQIRARRVR